MRRRNAWIVVSDGGKARVFERQLPLGPLFQVGCFESSHESCRPYGRDRPGRVFESATSAHHAYDPRDWRGTREVEFILDLTSYLNEHYDAFDELYLCCPPRLLSELRGRLSPHLLPKVTRDYHKDFSHSTVEDIMTYIDASSHNNSVMGKEES